jgi:hypothetical protein
VRSGKPARNGDDIRDRGLATKLNRLPTREAGDLVSVVRDRDVFWQKQAAEVLGERRPN